VADDRLDTKVRTLIELRDGARNLKQQADAAMKRFREYEAELWQELQDQHGGLTTFTFEDLPPYGKVQIVRRKPTIFADVYDLDAATKALEERGLKDAALQMGVRKRVLNEIVRDDVEAGNNPPEGVSIRTSQGITITRR
jgi:hypothetical protein